jgi:L-amino acid N-acyltransferase YncA
LAESSRIIYRPSQKADLWKLPAGGIISNGLEACKSDEEREALYTRLVKCGTFITAVNDEGILGLAGITQLYEKVGYAWMGPTRVGLKHPLAISRRIKIEIDRIAARLDLHRVQADVWEEAPISIKFVEWVGFEYEGRMPKYTPDGDTYLRYARVY